jgi:hypothetical protein
MTIDRDTLLTVLALGPWLLGAGVFLGFVAIAIRGSSRRF